MKPPAFALAAACVLFLVRPAAAEPKPQPTGEMLRVDVDGVYALGDDEAAVVVLRSRARPIQLVHIFIGPSEALAIHLRLHRRMPPRPLTHDLLEDVLSRTGATVEKVYV